MAKKRPTTSNPTLLKLHGTPFKTASELKSYEEKILMEEWQNIERARVRRELLMKEENRIVLAPLLKGLTAKFVGPTSGADHLVRVFLTTEDAIQVDIDHELKSKSSGDVIDSLVKSLVAGLVTGYLLALGLSTASALPIEASPVKSNRK